MEERPLKKTLAVLLTSALLFAQQGFFVGAAFAENGVSRAADVNVGSIAAPPSGGVKPVSPVSLGDMPVLGPSAPAGLGAEPAAPVLEFQAAPSAADGALAPAAALDLGAPAAAPGAVAGPQAAPATNALPGLYELDRSLARPAEQGRSLGKAYDNALTGAGGSVSAGAATKAAGSGLKRRQAQALSKRSAAQPLPAMQDLLDYGSRYVEGQSGVVGFKLAAPKASEMWVEVLPRGSPQLPAQKDNVDLAFLQSHTSDSQPAARWSNGYSSRIIKMSRDSSGVFKAIGDAIEPGSVYRYLLNTPEGLLKRPDIMSNQLAFGVAGGWSKTVDQGGYSWSVFETQVWRNPGAMPKERIASSAADPKGLQPKPIVAEINTSLYGGFASPRLRQAILELKSHGVNTIHLMPVEDFYGAFSWGYEGVQSAAPATAYGSPEELKKLVDFIHQQKINVVLDVVFNHRGPFYDFLDDYFQAFDPSGATTPWGNALNYDGAGNEPMRNLVISTLFKWAHDYHVDGFRFDMTKYMNSDSMLKEIVLQMRRYPETRPLVLIAEDGRNSQRVTAPIDPAEYQSQDAAQAAIGVARSGQDLQALGFDYEWYFDKVHVLLAALVTQRPENNFDPSLSNLERVLTQGPLWTEQGVEPALRRQMGGVTHDEIGNNGGTREVEKALISILNLVERAGGDGKLADQASFALIKGYIAQLQKNAGHETVNSAKNRAIWDPAVQQKLGYITNAAAAVTFSDFSAAFDVARKRYFQSMAANVIASPDAKMEFDRPGQLQPFRFFADWPDQNLRRQVSADKGYDVGGEGFRSSLPGQPDYNLPAFAAQAEQLHADAAALWRSNPALTDPESSGELQQLPLRAQRPSAHPAGRPGP
jgi:hypothetical protein